jgi:hypothetical protein
VETKLSTLMLLLLIQLLLLLKLLLKLLLLKLLLLTQLLLQLKLLLKLLLLKLLLLTNNYRSSISRTPPKAGFCVLCPFPTIIASKGNYYYSSTHFSRLSNTKK